MRSPAAGWAHRSRRRRIVHASTAGVVEFPFGVSGVFSLASPRAPALSVAAHGPDLTAHIDELEAVPRQFAECLPIARENRRHRAVRCVFDFVTIGRIEVSHGITDLIVFESSQIYTGRRPRDPSTTTIVQNPSRSLLLKLRWSRSVLCKNHGPRRCLTVRRRSDCPGAADRIQSAIGASEL